MISFSASWLSAETDYEQHLLAGYATLVLICLRLLWGFIGSKHARYSDFTCSPRAVFDYLESLPRGRAQRYIGHNPAAGAMAIVLLAGLLLVTLSGIALDGAENWSGPMSEMRLYRHTGLIRALHTLATDFLLLAILAHLLGVICSSLAHRENLLLSMISGKKRDN